MHIVQSSDISSNSQMLRLVSQFGTHYANTVVMGSRFGQLSEITTAYLAANWLTSIKASAELSVSGWGSSLSASAMYAEEQQQAQEYSESCTSQALYTMGSAPPANGDALSLGIRVVQRPRAHPGGQLAEYRYAHHTGQPP